MAALYTSRGSSAGGIQLVEILWVSRVLWLTPENSYTIIYICVLTSLQNNTVRNRTQISNSRWILSAIPWYPSSSSLRAASRLLQLGPPFSPTVSCLSSHASTMLVRYTARVLSKWLVTVVCDSPRSCPSIFSSSLFKHVRYRDTSMSAK